MKILIAAACICIIATTYYFFVREYEAHQDAEIVRAWQHRERCETLKANYRTDAERDELLECNRQGFLKY